MDIARFKQASYLGLILLAVFTPPTMVRAADFWDVFSMATLIKGLATGWALSAVVTVVVIAPFVWLVSKGKGWARWVLLAVTLVAWVVTVPSILKLFTYANLVVITGVIAVIAIVAQAYGLYLLFAKRGSAPAVA